MVCTCVVEEGWDGVLTHVYRSSSYMKEEQQADECRTTEETNEK